MMQQASESRARELGEAVRKRRRELGMSQEELACRCGLSLNYIKLVERGMGGSLLKDTAAEPLSRDASGKPAQQRPG
jgi:transcriptional regulator with XRE-family HTH domain